MKNRGELMAVIGIVVLIVSIAVVTGRSKAHAAQLADDASLAHASVAEAKQELTNGPSSAEEGIHKPWNPKDAWEGVTTNVKAQPSVPAPVAVTNLVVITNWFTVTVTNQASVDAAKAEGWRNGFQQGVYYATKVEAEAQIQQQMPKLAEKAIEAYKKDGGK